MVSSPLRLFPFTGYLFGAISAIGAIGPRTIAYEMTVLCVLCCAPHLQVEYPNAGGGVRYYIIIPYDEYDTCLLYTSPSPRDLSTSRMPSSA